MPTCFGLVAKYGNEKRSRVDTHYVDVSMFHLVLICFIPWGASFAYGGVWSLLNVKRVRSSQNCKGVWHDTSRQVKLLKHLFAFDYYTQTYFKLNNIILSNGVLTNRK